MLPRKKISTCSILWKRMFGKMNWAKKSSFLRVCSDSWVLDAFQRIHSEESKFFLPHDLELSNQELSHIVKRSAQWRGIHGERRKVSWSEAGLILLKNSSPHYPTAQPYLFTSPLSRRISKLCLPSCCNGSGSVSCSVPHYGFWDLMLYMFQFISQNEFLV